MLSDCAFLGEQVMVVSAPLTARARLVSQGVENLPHVDLAGGPPGLAGVIRGSRIFHWAYWLTVSSVSTPISKVISSRTWTR